MSKNVSPLFKFIGRYPDLIDKCFVSTSQIKYQYYVLEVYILCYDVDLSSQLHVKIFFVLYLCIFDLLTAESICFVMFVWRGAARKHFTISMLCYVFFILLSFISTYVLCLLIHIAHSLFVHLTINDVLTLDLLEVFYVYCLLFKSQNMICTAFYFFTLSCPKL